MGAIKLKKLGNSYGFTVPSVSLKKASLSTNDEFEMIIGHNSITFIKRKPPHDQWVFKDSELSEEDHQWLKADLGDVEE